MTTLLHVAECFCKTLLATVKEETSEEESEEETEGEDEEEGEEETGEAKRENVQVRVCNEVQPIWFKLQELPFDKEAYHVLKHV